MKIEGHKIKHLEIWLRKFEWNNRTKSQNRGIEGSGIYISDIMHYWYTAPFWPFFLGGFYDNGTSQMFIYLIISSL